MLAAYVLALAFGLSYGYAAAYNRRAERILLPILDILQSIPILSFLPSFVLALVALFPHGRTGVEIASILLIFTSQAWNLAFSFYHSLTAIPRDLREVGANFRLPLWLRLRYLELPYAAVGLVWNSMMSWAGGWFFLMESEMFTLKSHDFRLPGLGSYLQDAANRGSLPATLAGLLTLALVIVLMDQLIWRPVVAWAEKFKFETSEGGGASRSAVLILLRRSRLMAWLGQEVLGPLADRLDRAAVRRVRPQKEAAAPRRASRLTALIWIVLGAAGLFFLWRGALLIADLPRGLAAQLPVAALASALRVFAALAVTAAWTVPAGVAIGLNPRLAQRLQPIVQILASFPATAIFPGLVVTMIGTGGDLNVAAVVLMLLGTQWYVLFNVIAGASSIPANLKEAAQAFGVRGWARWRTVLLPSIFPYFITGMITAAGGAWNATIVAEYVRVRGTTLHVIGLGSLIATATDRGDYSLLLAATATLSLLVVLINRFLWQRLYRVAESRFSLNF